MPKKNRRKLRRHSHKSFILPVDDSTSDDEQEQARAQIEAEPLPGPGAPKANLSSIPVETVSRIANHLDPKALLNVSLTCRRLRSILLDRKLIKTWENAFKRIWPPGLWMSPYMELGPTLAALIWKRRCVTPKCGNKLFCPVRQPPHDLKWDGWNTQTATLVELMWCKSCITTRGQDAREACLGCSIPAGKRDARSTASLTPLEVVNTLLWLENMDKHPLSTNMCMNCSGGGLTSRDLRHFAETTKWYAFHLYEWYYEQFNTFVPQREQQLIARYLESWPGQWDEMILPYLRARPIYSQHVKSKPWDLTDREWGEIRDPLRSTIIDIAHYITWCIDSNFFDGDIPIPYLTEGMRPTKWH